MPDSLITIYNILTIKMFQRSNTLAAGTRGGIGITTVRKCDIEVVSCIWFQLTISSAASSPGYSTTGAPDLRAVVSYFKISGTFADSTQSGP